MELGGEERDLCLLGEALIYAREGFSKPLVAPSEGKER